MCAHGDVRNVECNEMFSLRLPDLPTLNYSKRELLDNERGTVPYLDYLAVLNNCEISNYLVDYYAEYLRSFIDPATKLRIFSSFFFGAFVETK